TDTTFQDTTAAAPDVTTVDPGGCFSKPQTQITFKYYHYWVRARLNSCESDPGGGDRGHRGTAKSSDILAGVDDFTVTGLLVPAGTFATLETRDAPPRQDSRRAAAFGNAAILACCAFALLLLRKRRALLQYGVLWRYVMVCVCFALVLIASNAQEISPAADQSTPLAVARAAVNYVLSGDMNGLLALYHPESENGRSLRRIEEQQRERFELFAEYLGSSMQAVQEALAIEASYGEEVVDGETVKIPVTFKSAKKSDFAHEGVMIMKQAGLPDKPGVAWYLFEDGMNTFVAAAEAASPDLADQLAAMRAELNARLLAMVEQAEERDRALAMASPAECAALFLRHTRGSDIDAAMRLA
ncbi:MAG TPA: hypothetical protein PKL84_19425, partial [Candidatus Hydrogenedentes bacterium]|nr:hypothetical protein [Candidatus Hydrogenedentota bacterium]